MWLVYVILIPFLLYLLLYVAKAFIRCVTSFASVCVVSWCLRALCHWSLLSISITFSLVVPSIFDRFPSFWYAFSCPLAFSVCPCSMLCFVLSMLCACVVVVHCSLVLYVVRDVLTTMRAVGSS